MARSPTTGTTSCWPRRAGPAERGAGGRAPGVARSDRCRAIAPMRQLPALLERFSSSGSTGGRQQAADCKSPSKAPEPIVLPHFDPDDGALCSVISVATDSSGGLSRLRPEIGLSRGNSLCTAPKNAVTTASPRLQDGHLEPGAGRVSGPALALIQASRCCGVIASQRSRSALRCSGGKARMRSNSTRASSRCCGFMSS